MLIISHYECLLGLIMRSSRVLIGLVLCAISAGMARADTIPIDLNDFFADPTVMVSADGSSALFTEEAGFDVLLTNDPFFGDPEVIVAGLGTSVIFDFEFSEAAAGVDEFFAAVLGADGFSAGAAFEFFSEDSSSGMIEFDLSALMAEAFLGFQFALVSPDGGGDSTLLVSNMRLETAPVAVPEPSTAFLMLMGMAVMLGAMRPGKRQQVSTKFQTGEFAL